MPYKQILQFQIYNFYKNGDLAILNSQYLIKMATFENLNAKFSKVADSSKIFGKNVLYKIGKFG